MSISPKRTVVALMAAALLCWPRAAMSAPASDGPLPASLPALIAEALEQNPEVQAFEHRWAAAREEVPQAVSLDDPELTLTQWGIPSNLNVGRADETWVGIGQRFPYPGKLALKGTLAGKAAEAAQHDYQAKKREVVARVKAAYFQLFLVQQGIALHIEHQALLTEFIQIANRKYAVGQASQQEALRAEVELSRLHNSLLTMRQEQTAHTALLNTLLSRSPDAALGPMDELEYRPFPHTLEALTEQAIAHRPELEAARLRVEKGRQTTALAEKNRLPDFMVEVMRWDVHGDANQWQANFKMNLPGVFSGKYDARIRQAAAEAAAARAEQAALHNQTLFELHDFFTRIRAAEERIEVYRTGVLPQAEQALASGQIGYQAGKVEFLSLIESERTLLDLRLESVEALVGFWQAVAQLERSIGRELDF